MPKSTMEMKAMIFAAGKGTRLGALTKDLPKALVPLKNKPLIAHVLDKLRYYGFREIIVNVHHHADKLEAFLKSYEVDNDLIIRISDERKQLLDTGGAIRQARKFFDDKAILIYNTDIISDINLHDFARFFAEKNPVALMAVRKRTTSRYLLFDKNMQLCGWKNLKSGEELIARKTEELQELAFSGIHFLAPQFYNNLPDEDVFSIIPLYVRNASEQKILGYDHSMDFWADLGKPDQLYQLENRALKFL